ncbi:MAG: ABC transporter permease subunit, partial [Actinomycetota bacterium]
MATDAHPVKTRARPPWLEMLGGQTLALLSALVFAALVGSVIILLYGESPLIALQTIWAFSTSRPLDFAYVLENSTPLIFSGLAVAVAFKAGLFNIGVEGQYIVGMMTAAAAALHLGFLGPLHLPVVILAAVAGAMVWAAVPAILKVKTGAHEVVTT